MPVMRHDCVSPSSWRKRGIDETIGPESERGRSLPALANVSMIYLPDSSPLKTSKSKVTFYVSTLGHRLG